tara:strand:+ start:6205 stop:7032 length:828 start_codon:yes stop_codon:yes gene_type:complete
MSNNELDLVSLEKNLINDFLESLLKDPSHLGFAKNFGSQLINEQRKQLIKGEFFALLSQHFGNRASRILKQGQWGHESKPDWFDHRHHFLNPDEEFKNSWTESISLVLRLLPRNGSVLNLCAGDAFYDHYFLKNSASRITCVDLKPKDDFKDYLIKKHTIHENVDYIFEDVLSFKPRKVRYDIVWIRGAIEHFSGKNQIKIFELAKESLNEGGWFVGDTPANPAKQATKQHAMHENEWSNVNEAEEILRNYFSEIHVYSLFCNCDGRETIFWKCR